MQNRNGISAPNLGTFFKSRPGRDRIRSPRAFHNGAHCGVWRACCSANAIKGKPSGVKGASSRHVHVQWPRREEKGVSSRFLAHLRQRLEVKEFAWQRAAMSHHCCKREWVTIRCVNWDSPMGIPHNLVPRGTARSDRVMLQSNGSPKDGLGVRACPSVSACT